MLGTSRAFATLAVFGCWSLVSAQPIPSVSPESVGFSPERLSRIDDALIREVEEGRIPGGVLAIARHGKLAYYEAFGYLELREHDIVILAKSTFFHCTFVTVSASERRLRTRSSRS